MSECSVSVKEYAPFVEAIQAISIQTKVPCFEYMPEAFDAKGLRPSFIKMLADNGIKNVSKMSKREAKKAAKLAVEQYNRHHGDINTSTKDSVTTVEVEYGYDSVASREFAKKKVSELVLDSVSTIINRNGLTLDKQIEDTNKKTGNKFTRKSYLAGVVISRTKQMLMGRLVKNHAITKEQAMAWMNTQGGLLEVRKVIEKSNNSQDKNLLALYEEMTGKASRDKFFKEVFRDSRLGNLRIDSQEEIANAEYEVFDEQDGAVEDSSENSDDSTKDNTIRQYGEHLGDISNFTAHVDDDIKSLLGSLMKCNTSALVNGRYDYDTNNALGIPECMDATTCAAVLYSYVGDSVNISDMIEKIRIVADSLPGYAGFVQLADFLKQNPDFAFKFYTNFAKPVISKIELVSENGRVRTQQSNRKIDKATTLRFEYQNSVKQTVLTTAELNHTEMRDSLKEIETTAEEMKSLDLEKEDARKNVEALEKEMISKLSKILKLYYPSVTEAAIANYIKNNKRADVSSLAKNHVRNLNTLVAIARKTITGAYLSRSKYDSVQQRIRAASKAKKDLLETVREDPDAKIPKQVMDKANAEYTKAVTENYISKESMAAANELANALVRFTPVKTELNSKNVHGNLTSSVLNNNFISNLMATLQNEVALGNYGKMKFQSAQYDFSNILLEHRDENNNIINYGLFRIDDKGKPVPTEYATRLLKSQLFDGSSNLDTASNETYSQMPFMDYSATNYVSFFEVERDYNLEEGAQTIDMANYFMRIPSDAPKQFVITAPKYKVGESQFGANDGLFKLTEEGDKAVTQYVERRIGELNANSISESYFNSEWPSFPVEEDKATFINDITNDEISDKQIANVKTIKKVGTTEDGKTIGQVAFVWNINDRESEVCILEGTVEKRGNKTYLASPKLQGIVGSARTTILNNELKKVFRKEAISSGNVPMSINREHPMFQQIKQMIMGELTEAATALDVMFDLKEGKTQFDKDGNFVFKNGFSNNKESASRLYQGYHVGKGKSILEKNTRDKTYHLTGKVFSSDKLVTKKVENGKVIVRNYGQEFIDETIDFLYGDSSETNILGKERKAGLNTTRKPDGNVKIQLTETQERVLNEKVEEFIRDYTSIAQQEMQKFEKAVPARLVTEENVNEYALNTFVNGNNFNDLFEGVMSAYKSSQDFLKRAKEHQGSGVPYGVMDYKKDLTEDVQDIPSSLDAGFTAVSADGKKTPYKISLRDGFHAVTVNNTVRTSENVTVKGVNEATKDGALTKQLAEVLHKQGFTKTEALARAREKMKSFGNVTTNDAQSYITFDEWVRRITAKGQLPKYKALIEAILDESKPVDANLYKQFVQVQKNFYYDQWYNPKLKVMMPRQIKNAEFVLIPRFIRGTELEKVHELMTKHNIDQLNTVETTKAAKCDILTLWDDTGKLTEENIAAFEAGAEAAAQPFSYNYLYTQQETPSHLNKTNKVGIQFIKKIIDNIPEGSPLSKHKKKFFQLYSQNIEESCAELLDEIGLSMNEDGTISDVSGIDYKALYDKFRTEAERLGLSSNDMDYFTLQENELDPDGDSVISLPKMPNYFSLFGQKAENIAQSLFNSRVTRQTLPGFHAAQITNIGFAPMRSILEKDNERELFNTQALDTSKVEYEIVDREKTKGFKNKALRIYLKGKKKGWFELVKDKEEGYYSVHFKTRTAKGEGHTELEGLSIEPSTREERTILFEELAKAVPAGAKVSTWGTLSVGGVKALSRLGEQNHWKQIDSREVGKVGSDSKISIPVFEKPAVSYSKRLRYHPDGQNYVEIMLPAKALGLKRYDNDGRRKSDEELLQELEDAGLSKVIGYRIPTEAKVSMCSMKIVGFTDDTYDSTIVVPDDWVAQTGSDFDIDSVYGINFQTRINKKTSKIEKIPYKEEATQEDYVAYIKRKLDRKLDTRLTDKVKQMKKELYDEHNAAMREAYYDLQEQKQELYDSISPDMRGRIEQMQAIKTSGKTKAERYVAQLTNVIEGVQQLDENAVDAETKQRILDIYTQIRDFVENTNDADVREKLAQGINTLKGQLTAQIEQLAKEAGLPSYRDFYMMPSAKRNTKAARNNRLLENIFSILEAEESMEENLSCSKFTDIIEARDALMPDSVKELRNNRSPLNIFDQAEYQEDVTSGMKLKAFSVTRDTVVSVFNTVHPHLTAGNTISVVYPKEGFNKKQLETSFGKDNVVETENGFLVTHTTIGWTNNNRNVKGELLTAYTAQTTAHQLDVVKEGSVPNVDDFTFKVYKTLPDIGADYATACGFIMQPAVTRIVQNNNESKSIFQTEYLGDPVERAMKDIAKEYMKSIGMTVAKGAKISDKRTVLPILAKHKEKLAALFGVPADMLVNKEGKFVISNLPISQKALADRIKEQGVFANNESAKLLFDLASVMQYMQIQKVANAIGEAARVLNPDKFGAKQSLFATRQIFRKINELTATKRPVIIGNNGVGLLQSVYPDLFDAEGKVKSLEDFLNTPSTGNSAYPSLQQFLKYATGLSVVANSRLFKMESDVVSNRLFKLEELFSDGKELNEETYNKFKKYCLGDAYLNTRLITEELLWGDEQGLEEALLDEKARIFGYGKPSNFVVYEKTTDAEGKTKTEQVEFKVEDINHPTETEIEQFKSLSPAQKVSWIQQNFTRDAGIFKFLTANMSYEKSYGNFRVGSQTITYADSVTDIETALSEFEKCFYNDNPLVAEAARDLVRYAMVVEGFSIKRNGVSKVISNRALLDNTDETGTHFVEDCDRTINLVEEGSINFDEQAIDFIRANAMTMSEIATRTVRRNPETKALDLPLSNQQVILLDTEEQLKKVNTYAIGRWGKLPESMGGGNGKEGLIKVNRFVKLKINGQTTLYEIRPISRKGGETGLILTPMNLLEANEHGKWSANPLNNRFPSRNFYRNLVSKFEQQQVSQERIGSEVNSREALTAATNEMMQVRKDYTAPARSKKGNNHYAKPFDLNKPSGEEVGGFERVRSEIAKFAESVSKDPLYLRSRALGRYITYSGTKFGSVQNINGRKYIISKANLWKQSKQYLAKGKTGVEISSKVNPNIRQLLEQARNEGTVELNDVFMVTPYVEPDISSSSPVEEMDADTFDSSIDEDYSFDSSIDESTIEIEQDVTKFGAVSMQAMEEAARFEGDEDARKAIRSLSEQGITREEDVIRGSIVEVVRNTAQYVEKAAQTLMRDINYFFQDEEGNYHSIDDPATIEHIRNNKAELQRYQKLMVTARAFAKRYEHINALDIEATEADLNTQLTKIKNAVSSIENSKVIERAEKLFATDYLAGLSTNPNVQADANTVLGGFHSTGVFDAYINDLQETANPLLQIVTKEVMQDIRAKEMIAERDADLFQKAVDKIKAKAGGQINWSHIIDDNGDFVQAYNEAFVEKISELRDAMAQAKADFGEGSVEALKAQLEYNKFKAGYVNQKLKTEYYDEMNALDEYMLTTHPSVYSAYQQLAIARRKVYQREVNGTLSAEDLEEIKRINKEIDELTSSMLYDDVTGGFEAKDDPNSPEYYRRWPGNDPEAKRQRTIHGATAATAINDYLKKRKALKEKYFTSGSKFGFEEELEKNLNIVERYEIRDEHGRVTNAQELLDQNPTYAKAKQWLMANAKYVVNKDLKEAIEKAFKKLQQQSANKKSKLSSFAKLQNAYDENGVIDARKLTEPQIEALRQEQLMKWNNPENLPFSPRSIVSNAPDDNTVFKKEFYERLKASGLPNQEYIKLVRQINEILAPHFDPQKKQVRVSDCTLDELLKLNDLFDAIEGTKKTTNKNERKRISKYIEENCDTIINQEAVQDDLDRANDPLAGHTPEWRAAYADVTQRVMYDSNLDADVVVPNPRLFSYIVPKGYVKGQDHPMIDHERTEALETIRTHTTRTTTKYYYEKIKEMRAQGEAAYNEWYAKNHIWNPYTHSREPISCWTKMEIVDPTSNQAVGVKGEWIPRFNQTENVPKEEYRNKEWKEGQSLKANFKTNPVDGKYTNTTQMTDAEREMRDLFQGKMRELAKTASAKRWVEEGHALAKAKAADHDAKFWLRETAKMAGWVNTSTGYDHWTDDSKIDGAYDRVPSMPFMTRLTNRDSKKIDYIPPKKKENETDDEYNKRLAEYQQKRSEMEAENRKIHADLLDRNWEAVMQDFIKKAGHYNAVQDNKYMLFYAKNMLKRMPVYAQNLGFKNLRREQGKEGAYVQTDDKLLEKQYINWLRRLVYDQWKSPHAKLSKITNVLQSLSSAKFMAFNLTGGIANVTVGETSAFAEAAAREYFSKSEWAVGIAEWHRNIPYFLADLYSEEAHSLGSAIVKAFNIVDFDEVNGVVAGLDPAKGFKIARDVMFSLQTMGEHGMQNGVLFSMLKSHRLVENTSNDGRPRWIPMNEKEFLREEYQKALMNILSPEQKELFAKFKKYEFGDANRKKEYMRFRKNIVTQFVSLYLEHDQQKQFNKEVKKLEEEAKKKFKDDKEHPTLYSQLKLVDGKLGFQENSILASLGDDAYQILAGFKNRVISVNKKIHGVYDKMGAAMIENHWLGGIAMQYHKHIVPGFMKRYRRQGYYNEERGSIEKGFYYSIKDFLSLPLKNAKFISKLKKDTGMTDESLRATQGIQNVCKAYVDFATHINLYWNMLPETERANVRRVCADLLGVLASFCIIVGLRAISGDDDENDNLAYNLCLYEADRLATESAMYTPIGLISEAKKLWSSPVAVQGYFTDAWSTLGVLAGTMTQGDEYDPEYQTGLYAGENKVEVLLKRNIPVWHQYQMLSRMNKSNKYYKLGKNMLSFMPVDPAVDFVRGK